MAGKSKRPKLAIEPAELLRLQRLRQAPMTPLREVQRAQILTRYHAGETVTQIARNLDMTPYIFGLGACQRYHPCTCFLGNAGCLASMIGVLQSGHRWRKFDALGEVIF